MPHAVRVLVALPLLVVMGCAPSSGRVPVKGKISLDGEPVNMGHIIFLPEFAEGVPAAIQVLDGEYALDERDGPRVGKHRVVLNWERKTGNKVPDLTSPRKYLIDELKEAFPPEYNARSKLYVDIKRGANHLDFDIKTAAAP